MMTKLFGAFIAFAVLASIAFPTTSEAARTKQTARSSSSQPQPPPPPPPARSIHKKTQ
jgi:hypothetical protein